MVLRVTEPVFKEQIINRVERPSSPGIVSYILGSLSQYIPKYFQTLMIATQPVGQRVFDFNLNG